jgi:hypothetical protein
MTKKNSSGKGKASGKGQVRMSPAAMKGTKGGGAVKTVPVTTPGTIDGIKVETREPQPTIELNSV